MGAHSHGHLFLCIYELSEAWAGWGKPVLLADGKVWLGADLRQLALPCYASASGHPRPLGEGGMVWVCSG